MFRTRRFALALPLACSLCSIAIAQYAAQTVPHADTAWTVALQREASTLGKPGWRPMLAYDVMLHGVDTHPAQPPFAFPWEDTGRGYGYGPGFGHWDIVHEILDVLPTAPDHAYEQLLNDVRLQLPSGFLPGVYWMRQPTKSADPHIYEDPSSRYSATQSHPPVWVVAADDYLQQKGATTPAAHTLAAEFLKTARLQLGWFERERRAQPDGFFYLDIVNQKWESGVDQGIRFDDIHHPSSTACVDATAQVYQEYVYAAKWAKLLGEDPKPFTTRASHLRKFIQTKLWDSRDGFFYDSWVLNGIQDGSSDKRARTRSFEGMWPVVVGAATPTQAHRIIHEWLLRPDRFFTPHPISTVARSDPKFELRMWRGPVWNSMTYWAARGSIRYGDRSAAHQILEAALDDTAQQFTRTGIIWEFYDPMGNHPEDLKRKPETKRNAPFPDYMGHNPLLAMARMWESTSPK